MLRGIVRDGKLIPPEPWSTPATEQEMETRRNSLIAQFEGLSQRIEAARRAPAVPDGSIALGEARVLLDAARGAGAIVTLEEDGQLRVRGQVASATLDRLRAHREAIVRILRSEAGG
jgi:hypothetical protein